MIEVEEKGKTIITYDNIKFVLKKTTKEGNHLYYPKVKGTYPFRIVKVSD